MEARRFSRISPDPEVSKKSASMLPIEESVDEQDGQVGYSLWTEMRNSLAQWAQHNHAALYLRGDKPPAIVGLNAVFRTAPTGALQIELVAQIVETDEASAKDPKYGGIPLRGGCTIIVGIDGAVRYVIGKPLPSPHLPVAEAAHAAARVETQGKFVEDLDRRDPRTLYMTAKDYPERMLARMSLRALHEGC